jgi:murein DD-endopeptidase MepM/ murein hydrolase activator NlpD
MALPLLAGVARVAAGGLTKAATSKVTQSAAKRFVSGGNRKVGKSKPSVEKKTKDNTGTTTTTSTTPRQKKVSTIKIPSSVYKTTKGTSQTKQIDNVSYESLSKQLDNINKTTKSLVDFAESEKEIRKEYKKETKRKTDKEKAKRTEERLEKKRKGGINIPGIGISSSMKGGIFDFISNILMGGLVLFLLNNYKTIENVFSTIVKNFENPFNIIKDVVQGISTVFGGPIKSFLKGSFNVLLTSGKALKNATNKIGPKMKKVFGKVGSGLVNFVTDVVGKVKRAVLGGGATGAAKGISTSSAGMKGAVSSVTKTTAKETSKQTGKKLFGEGAKRIFKIKSVFKRVPVIGAFIGLFIDLLMGEPLDRAVVGAIGSGIGAWIGGGIGSLVFPFAGTAAGAILGSMIGDWGGKALYELIKQKMGFIPKVKSEGKENQKGKTPTDKKPYGVSGSGNVVGGLNITGAHTTYYDPSLGGINASGYKTADGLPATSTGEGYRPEVFSAAAFPPLLAMLPSHMTVPARGFPGGRTLKKPFHVIVTNSQGKKAVIRVNDVGPGVAGHKSNHMLDLSVAAKNYLGTGGGFSIQMASDNSRPGPLTQTKSTPNLLKTTPQRGSQETQAIQTPGVIRRQGATTGGTKGSVVSGFPVTSGYGMRSMGYHKGIDIGTPVGTYVALDTDVEIIFASKSGNYGYVVDAWSPSLGLQFRLAHLSQFLVSKGQKVPAGTALGRTGGAQGDIGAGRSTGPHLHFEVDNKRGGMAYGGMGDPSAFVGHLILSSKDPTGQMTGQKVNISPSQTVPVQSSNVQRYASYEMSGGQSNVVPVPVPAQSPMISGGGGSGPVVMGGSTKDVVNSYYKSQLMGFLYKQG